MAKVSLQLKSIIDSDQLRNQLSALTAVSDGNGSDNYERPHSNQPRSGNDNNASMDKEEGKGGRGYCYGGY